MWPRRRPVPRVYSDTAHVRDPGLVVDDPTWTTAELDRTVLDQPRTHDVCQQAYDEGWRDVNNVCPACWPILHVGGEDEPTPEPSRRSPGPLSSGFALSAIDEPLPAWEREYLDRPACSGCGQRDGELVAMLESLTGIVQHMHRGACPDPTPDQYADIALDARDQLAEELAMWKRTAEERAADLVEQCRANHGLRAENARLRSKLAEAQSALAYERGLGAECTCSQAPNYAGPAADCAVHGAVRAYNEAFAKLEAIRALHTDSVAGVCPSCGRIGDVSDTDDGLVNWPCPTILAIDPNADARTSRLSDGGTT